MENLEKMKILVVEDEKDIRELVHFNLYREGHKVYEATSGEEALRLAVDLRPDLILLDLMLPKIDGLTICRELKTSEKTKDIKIIIVSAKSEEDDIVKGLEIGADDYITKPFSLKILLARVKAALRSVECCDSDHIESHGVCVDLEKREVLIDGSKVSFSATEFQILKIFLSSPGRVLSRGQIVSQIKGDYHAVTDRSVDTQVVSLRKKMKEKGKLIETVWGVGYRFKED